MDSTRRVLTTMRNLFAAGLGALIAIPLAALLAAAIYLRAAALGLVEVAKVLGISPEQAPPKKTDAPPKRMAS